MAQEVFDLHLELHKKIDCKINDLIFEKIKQLNTKQAKVLFDMCIKDSSSSCTMNLSAICYKYGIGISKNLSKAFEYYQKSADLGNSIAMHNLGQCYEEGTGVESDEQKAFEWYQKSAELENPNALCCLALCYEKGIYINRDTKKSNRIISTSN